MNGAWFAGILCPQILRRKKRTFQLTRRKKKIKIKITEEEIGLEPERVHARHLEPRHARQSNAPLQPSRFQSVILKALTFQTVIGYLSVEVFSICRIVFSIKKRGLTRFLSALK